MNDYSKFPDKVKGFKRGKPLTPIALQRLAQTSIEFLGDCPIYDEGIASITVDRAKTCLLASGYKAKDSCEIIALWLESINDKSIYNVLITRLRKTK